MNKLKNSFALGTVLGLVLSFALLVILDATLYFIYQYKVEKPVTKDVVFACCIMVSLLLARKFFRNEEKQELAKGLLLASFLWGVAYVYLFHVAHIKTILFRF